MQIFKSLFMVCAVVTLADAPSLPAGESEAQAKAREALRKKMSELDAQEKGKSAPAPATPTQAQPAPVPAAPAPAQPVAATPAPASPPPAPAPVRVDDEATARAREALRRKISELDAQEKGSFARAPVAPAPVPQASAPAPVTQPQAPPPVATAPSSPQPSYVSTRQIGDDEPTAKARAALRRKMAELDAQQFPGKPAPFTTVAASPTPQFNPSPPPPLPISGSKEARLAELLRQYRVDQITPEVYHKERAKILAEP